jgi:hypothetical protein
MRAYIVSKESKLTEEEKVEKINNYSAADLLYVLREFETHPSKYTPEIMEAVYKKLYDKGIMCI